MEEAESKICENCKREIPAVNFTTHTVFCERNIRVCPVCKEPVPQPELQEHHEKFHKLLPCKECGESVCGTDLEDHIRDSCGHTMKSCKFCALELRRSAMPAHERYCGARTEQCPDCGEWVMHKYRQLHLDSNHGFIRLDDDPVPTKKDDKTTNVPKPLNAPQPDDSFVAIRSLRLINPRNGYSNNINLDQPLTQIRRFPMTRNYQNAPGSSHESHANRSLACIIERHRHEVNPFANDNQSSHSSNNSSSNDNSSDANASSSAQNGAIPRNRRTMEQIQADLFPGIAAIDKATRELWQPKGAMKKRPAPKPPVTEAPADPRRHLPLDSALRRQQAEERQRQEQAYNSSAALPPVLIPAQLSTFQNYLADDEESVNRLRNSLWARRDLPPSGEVLGSSSNAGSKAARYFEASRRKTVSKSKSPERVPETEVRRNDLKDLKPMTPEEFMNRFSELQLRQPGEERQRGDRFSQIKSSLKELRRDLNEVTAPYNVNANNEPNQSAPSSPVRLPCEFCGELVPAEDLVQHQTGCRPDLAQLRAPAEPAVLIPCEFCAQPQPVYLLSEHQELCGRDDD